MYVKTLLSKINQDIIEICLEIEGERKLLFKMKDLKGYLVKYKSWIRDEIKKAKPEYILNVDRDDYLKSTIFENSPVDLIVDFDRGDIRKFKTKYIEDINGEEYYYTTVWIPYQGDFELFECKPNPWTEMEIKDYSFRKYESRSYLEISFRTEIDEKDRVNDIIEDNLEIIEENIVNINSNIREFIQELNHYAKDLFDEVYKKYSIAREITESIKIPLFNKMEIPKKIQIVQKIIHPKPEMNVRTKQEYYELELEIYKTILELCYSMSRTMELNFETFRNMGEEAIRNAFLVSLNAIYKGEAMGEVFNRAGKTDIIIRYKNKNVFICECKFWDGPKSLEDAIDQLFTYNTWRDTKTAIFLFNNKVTLTTILNKVDGIIRNHNNFKRENKLELKEIKFEETNFSYIFKHPRDDMQELFLTIMVFDLF